MVSVLKVAINLLGAAHLCLASTGKIIKWIVHLDSTGGGGGGGGGGVGGGGATQKNRKKIRKKNSPKFEI